MFRVAFRLVPIAQILLATSALLAQQTSPEVQLPGHAEAILGGPSVASTSGALSDEADLEVFSFDARERLNPGEPLQYSLEVANRSQVAARNVLLRVELPPAASFVNVISLSTRIAWSCGQNGGVVLCSTASHPYDSSNFQINVISPSSPRGAVLTARASVSSDTPDPRPENNARTQTSRVNRILIVSSAADSGPGSLRETLEEANRGCDRDGVPCRVLFQILPPTPASGWFTILLASPLPPITVTDITLEGNAQTAYTGDTNPSGPEIYLDGEALGEGNGLEVRSSGDFEATGLVVSGFPGNGILFDAEDRSSFRASYVVRNSYIGTDPTGAIAVPNHLRGIAVFVQGFAQNPFRWAQAPIAHLTIDSNVISGNGRSGIIVHSGYYVTVRGNRIGVKARSDEPLPNGASGIYFGLFAGLGCVFNNLIAHNSDFGIALERQVPNVWILQNSIKGNSIFGVDIGLDLTTPGGTDGVIARPMLTSPKYDGSSGKTTISGLFPTPAVQPLFVTVDLYSNSTLQPKGEGETWLGSVQRAGRDDFSFVADAYLLGKSITATVTRTNYEGFVVADAQNGRAGQGAPPAPCQEQGFLQQTSEFSEPVIVTR